MSMDARDVAIMAAWWASAVAVSVGVSVWLHIQQAESVPTKAVSIDRFLDYKESMRESIAGLERDIRDMSRILEDIRSEVYRWGPAHDTTRNSGARPLSPRGGYREPGVLHRGGGE